jgi:hypothetical protein
LLLLPVLVAGCGELTADFSRVIALEIEGSLQRSVEEGDTLQLTARALDAAGGVVSEAPIAWVVLDVDSGQLGFTLDSAGLVTGLHPGSGRVRAQHEDLFGDPITINVTAAPDSIAAAGPQRVTVAAAGEQSEGLIVAVFDTSTTSGAQLPLPGKEVRYGVVDPDPNTGAADGVFLTVADTEPGDQPHALSVTTDASGNATAVVRKAAGATPPDSVTVDVTVTTALGQPVGGSPVRFVVVFEANP